VAVLGPVDNCHIVRVLYLPQLYTPLHAAAASGSVNVARILLVSGAEVDARNSYGNTPLHIACLNGHSNVCSELTYYGADINALNYRGQVSVMLLYCMQNFFFSVGTA
jgi:ankyrin repeat protein